MKTFGMLRVSSTWWALSFLVIFLASILTTIIHPSVVSADTPIGASDGNWSYLQVTLNPNPGAAFTITAKRQQNMGVTDTVTFTRNGSNWLSGQIRAVGGVCQAPTPADTNANIRRNTFDITVVDNATGGVIGTGQHSFCGEGFGIYAETIATSAPRTGLSGYIFGRITYLSDTGAIKPFGSGAQIKVEGNGKTYNIALNANGQIINQNGQTIFDLPAGNYTLTGNYTPSRADDGTYTRFVQKTFTVTDGNGTDISSRAVKSTEIPDADKEQPTCENQNPGLNIAWLICGIIRFMDGVIGVLDAQIQRLLIVDKGQYGSDQVKNTARTMRNIALSVLLPIMLVMVIGTALDFGPLDAYTVKKALPRMIAAAIFMVLAYPITTFLVELSNVVGSGVIGLISNAFGQGGKPVSLASLLNAGDTLSIFSAMAAGGLIVGAASLVSVGIIFSMAATALGGLLIGFLVLVLRQVIVLMWIVLAPVAILPWIFPGNDKLWKLWRSAGEGALLFYPIYMAFIGISWGFASLVKQGDFGPLAPFIIIIVIVFGYASIKFALSIGGAALSAVTGMTNNASKGFFDRQKNLRSNIRKSRAQEDMEGKSSGTLRSAGGSLRRRAALASKGGFSMSKSGRAQFRAAEQGLIQNAANESLKHDGGRYAGDDDATALGVQEGMTESKFLEQYAARLKARGAGRSDAERKKMAYAAMGGFKSSFGDLGTKASRIAAFKARTSSNTGYMSDDNTDPSGLQMYQDIYQDAGSLISSGLMTPVDAAIAIKSNRGRADMNSSFGSALEAATEAGNNYVPGRTGPVLSAATAEKVRATAFHGSDTGAIFGGHGSTVKHYAKFMTARGGRIERTMQGADERAKAQLAAEVAGRYDYLSNTSPEKADEWSKVMDAPIDDGKGGTVTMRQYIDDLRGRKPDDEGQQAFWALRREFQSQTASEVDRWGAQNRSIDEARRQAEAA